MFELDSGWIKCSCQILLQWNVIVAVDGLQIKTASSHHPGIILSSILHVYYKYFIINQT